MSKRPLPQIVFETLPRLSVFGATKPTVIEVMHRRTKVLVLAIHPGESFQIDPMMMPIIARSLTFRIARKSAKKAKL